MPTWRRAVRQVLRFVVLLWHQIQQDKVAIRASGLAYITLLNVVPLVAVLFALLAAFGALEGLTGRAEEMLFSLLVPTHQDEITRWIDQFTGNASSLGFFGFLILIATSIMLLDGIESNFNDIWHVRRSRTLIAKITSYTAVLVMGSVLIGASLSISARVQTILHTNRDVIAPLTRTMGWLLPLALTFAAFTLMYLIVPNTAVGWRNAALGAACASVVWELGKRVFAAFIGQSVQYSTLYGSLATVPIFLVWLAVTWIIILVGLEIAFTRRHMPALVAAHQAHRRAGLGALHRVLSTVLVIAERFEAGAEPPSLDELAERSRVDTGRLQEDLRPLFDTGMLREASRSDRDTGLVPGRSLDRLTLGEVVATLLGLPDGSTEDDQPARMALDALRRYRAGGDQAAGDATLEQLIARSG